MSGVNNVILLKKKKKKKKKLKIYVYIFVIIIERNLTSVLNLTKELKIQLAKRKKKYCTQYCIGKMLLTFWHLSKGSSTYHN